MLIAWEQENGINGHMNGCDQQLERESSSGHCVFCKKKQDPCRQRTTGLFPFGTKDLGFAGQDNGLHEKGKCFQAVERRERKNLNKCLLKE